MTPQRSNDFPDWLPPVLVKELRQGMRGSPFMGVFITLQAAMSALMIFAVADPTSTQGGELVSMILFAIFGITVVLVQPLRLVNTLVSEVKSGTMETMSMARQGAMRIVLGKWFAIAGQTTLLFLTFLPYLLLRYFLGGMDLMQEVLFLTILFIASLVLSAMTLGLSACKSPFVRYGIPVLIFPISGLILWLMMWPNPLADHRAGAFLMLDPSPGLLKGNIPWLLLGTVSVMSLYYCYSFLAMGASIFSTRDETRVAMRRIIPLVFLLVTLWIEIPTLMTDGKLFQIEVYLVVLARTLGIAPSVGSFSSYYVLGLLVACPALVLALTETTPAGKSGKARFSRFGIVEKPAGIFLMPTRSSGLLYAVVLSSVLIGHITMDSDYPWKRSESEVNAFVSMATFPATLLFPAVCQSILPRVFQPGLDGYLKLLIVSILAYLVANAIPGISANRLIEGGIVSWHPLGANLFPDIRKNATALDIMLPIYLLILCGSAVMGMRRGKARDATVQSSPLPISSP